MLNLTVAQQDIYLEGKIFGQVINNIGGYQKYLCRLDVPRFQRARELLLQGNDAYRLRFRETGGECVPFVSDDLPSSLRVIDCPTEASALGAAMAAAKGVGWFGGIEEAAEAMASATIRTFEPDARRVEVYRELRQIQAELWPLVSAWNRRLVEFAERAR